jgi:hypothetical protein
VGADHHASLSSPDSCSARAWCFSGGGKGTSALTPATPMALSAVTNRVAAAQALCQALPAPRARTSSRPQQLHMRLRLSGASAIRSLRHQVLQAHQAGVAKLVFALFACRHTCDAVAYAQKLHVPATGLPPPAAPPNIRRPSSGGAGSDAIRRASFGRAAAVHNAALTNRSQLRALAERPTETSRDSATGTP